VSSGLDEAVKSFKETFTTDQPAREPAAAATAS
jgi:hypothetical protein